MSRSSRDSQERSRELRAALGCIATERTIMAARRLVAERDALLEWYCANKLAPTEARMLKSIAAGHAASIGALAEHLGVHERGKGFRNNLGRLRGIGLVDGLKIAAVLR